MARIPEFTQEVFLDRNNDTATSIGQIGFNKARQAQLDGQMYEERGAAAQKWGEIVQSQRDIQGELKARERFNQFQRAKIERQQTQQNERMTSPDGFAQDFDNWHREEAGNIELGVEENDDGSPFDFQTFRQLMDNDRTSSYANNSNWENGMRVKNISTGIEQNVDAMNVNFSLSNPGLKDLGAHSAKIKEYVTSTGEKVLGPDDQHRLAAYGIDNAARGVIDNLKVNDPIRLRNVVKYGAATKDQLINFVFDVEGGDQIAQEPDGAIAKYGINSKAHGMTHDQVKNLTQDQAYEILSSKYWDPRLDKMDPAMRAIAFDALVNHGNDDGTWKMIDAAKGDPYALIGIRQKYYGALIAKNPEKYSKYKSGWDGRMQQMTMYAQAQAEGGQEFLQYASMVSPEIINATINDIPAAIAAKERQDNAVRQQSLSEFNTAYKGAYDVLTNNLEPLGQEELNAVQQLAVNSGDEEAIGKANALVNMRTYVNNLKGMSDTQLRQVIRQRSAEVNKAPSPESRLALELTQGVLDTQTKAVETEGLAYWGRIGQIKMPQSIDYSDPNAAMAELRSREDSSFNVHQKTGKWMPVLTPDEVDNLKTAIDTMPANEASGLLGYFDGLDQTSKSRLAQTIDAKSPVLAAAISVDNLDARRRILAGSKMEGKYKKEDMEAEISGILDPMVVDSEFKATASAAVMAYYNSKAQEDRDFGEAIDSGRVDEAVTAIFGPRVDLSFAGTNEVFSFKDDTGYFVPDDDIYNMFNDVTDDQLVKILGKLPKGAMGETVRAKDIKENGRLVSAGDGLYNVVFDGIGGLYDDNGDLVEIDGRKLLPLYKKDLRRQIENYPGSNVKAIK